MSGRPKTVPDSEILRQVALTYGPATAVELADAVGIGRSGMNKRLNELVEEGYLNRKEAGANAVVYWLTDKGTRKAMEK